MNVRPISSTIPNNYYAKKSVNFKGGTLAESLNSLNLFPTEEAISILKYVDNASENVVGMDTPYSIYMCMILLPRSNTTYAWAFPRISNSNYVALKKNVENRLIEDINNTAECGEIDDAYKNQILALFPNDKELCEKLEKQIKKMLPINACAVKRKLTDPPEDRMFELFKAKAKASKEKEKEYLAKLEQRFEEEERVSAKKKAAFDMVFPVLSFLGLYRFLKDSNLAKIALEKASKIRL